MQLIGDSKAHLEATLQVLESKRNEEQREVAVRQARIKELNTSIATISRILNPDAPLRSSPPRPANLKYANISVRWAILDLLHDSKAKTTSELADALTAAGVESKAANFANNVSAVLSTTMTKHDEVQQLPDGRWELTSNGIQAIEHIRGTSKFRRGCGQY